MKNIDFTDFFNVFLSGATISGRRFSFISYLTYSITTRRLGSTPVEWVVMFSMS